MIIDKVHSSEGINILFLKKGLKCNWTWKYVEREIYVSNKFVYWSISNNDAINYCS